MNNLSRFLELLYNALWRLWEIVSYVPSRIAWNKGMCWRCGTKWEYDYERSGRKAFYNCTFCNNWISVNHHK